MPSIYPYNLSESQLIIIIIINVITLSRFNCRSLLLHQSLSCPSQLLWLLALITRWRGSNNTLGKSPSCINHAHFVRILHFLKMSHSHLISWFFDYCSSIRIRIRIRIRRHINFPPNAILVPRIRSRNYNWRGILLWSILNSTTPSSGETVEFVLIPNVAWWGHPCTALNLLIQASCKFIFFSFNYQLNSDM